MWMLGIPKENGAHSYGQKEAPGLLLRNAREVKHRAACTRVPGGAVKLGVRFTRRSCHGPRGHAPQAGITEHAGTLSFFPSPSAAQTEEVNVNVRPLGPSHDCYHCQGDVKQVGERFYVNFHQDHRCHQSSDVIHSQLPAM